MKTWLPYIACLIILALPRSAEAEAREINYLDAHIHFWDVNVQEGLKNWPGEQNEVLYRTFLPEHYLPQAKKLGITQTVMLQSGRTAEEIRWAIKISEPHADAFPGLVFNLNAALGKDDFDALYAEANKSDRFVGVRTLGGNISPKNEQLDAVIAHLERLAADNKTLDILTFGCRLRDIAALAERVPDLRIMVNAKGKVGYHSLSPDGPSEAWVQEVRQLAKHENIFIKLTGHTMPGVDDPHNPAYFKPYYDKLLEIVGSKRLVWGSNWPTLLNVEESLEMTVKHPTQHLAGLSVQDRRDIFQRNAARFYGTPMK
ncbi:MAG: amidohydrolase family protein [Planctomycetota bacterium]